MQNATNHAVVKFLTTALIVILHPDEPPARVERADR